MRGLKILLPQMLHLLKACVVQFVIHDTCELVHLAELEPELSCYGDTSKPPGVTMTSNGESAGSSLMVDV